MKLTEINHVKKKSPSFKINVSNEKSAVISCVDNVLELLIVRLNDRLTVFRV